MTKIMVDGLEPQNHEYSGDCDDSWFRTGANRGYKCDDEMFMEPSVLRELMRFADWYCTKNNVAPMAFTMV